MLKNDDQWLDVADAFANAALASEGWYGALEKLAEATGGTYGQLICIGPEAPQNNIWTVDPDVARGFFEEGFADPANNPRIRAGMAAPAGVVLADADFITPAAARRDPSYKWGRARGLGYICLSTLIQTGPNSLVGLAVNRTPAQGHASSAEKSLFGSLALQARAAVRTQMLLESSTANLLVGALDAMHVAAFACDRGRKVLALSPQAEQLVARGRFLKLRQNRLDAELSRDSAALGSAIYHAAEGPRRPGYVPLRSLFLRSQQELGASLLIDILSLPRKAFSFGFAPQVLVVVRGSDRHDAPLLLALQQGFGLTEGEGKVAIQLAKGRKPEMIASDRGVSIGTVRTQIKSIYEKMGIHHQGELVARLKPD